MNQHVYSVVSLACDKLEIYEVAALYMNTTLNNNANVEQTSGYDKVSYLFKDGKMHDETKEAFLVYCQTRLNQKD